MKKVVLLNELDMSGIISHSLYEEYVKLLLEDINTFLLKASLLTDVSCPGCGSNKTRNIYKKMEMRFNVCSECASHYVSPRPNPSMLQEFYRDSRACRYWRKETLCLPDEQLHRNYGPRASWVQALIDEFLPEVSVLIDMHTKYPYFLKHLIKEEVFQSIVTFKPHLFEKNELLPDSVVAVDNLDSYSDKVSILTAFDSLERMFNPKQLFELAGKCCKKGGLLLITTASCSGFEYHVLGENAPNINPINRMNLLSLEVLKNKINDAGFEIIELSTPGRLDVEFVRQTVKNLDNSKIGHFWRYIFDSRDEETWHNLQNFLQVNRLSSHVRIAAQKR